MPFLHEYLFKIRHRRTVLCGEKTGFAYLFCISVGGLVSCSQSVAVIRLSGYPRSIRLAVKCEILVLNFFSEEFVRGCLSASPLIKPVFRPLKGGNLRNACTEMFQ